MAEKFQAMEKKLELLYSQISKNTGGLKNISKDTANNSVLKTVQLVQNNIARDVQILKDAGPNTGPQVTIKNLQDVVEELEKSMDKNCIERASAKYPFGYDSTLEKLARKDTDLTQSEIQQCIQAGVSFADPIVSLVIFEILGVKLNEVNSGKLMSEFAKNLVAPLCTRDPQLRMKQKGQFMRIHKSWDKIMEFMINPGGLNASDIINDCKIAVCALKDGCAEKLPVGIKIRGLGLSCLTTPNMTPRNGSILEKIYELRPKIPTQLNVSFDPWPKTKMAWSNTMKNWAKDPLPTLRSLKFIDIGNPQDHMTTPTGQKEFAYQPAENGNIINKSKFPINKTEQKVQKNSNGSSVR
jgi:hypothetical protein